MTPARKAELKVLAVDIYENADLQGPEYILRILQDVEREVWLAAAQHASMQVVYAVDDKKLKDFADWCRTQAKETI